MITFHLNRDACARDGLCVAVCPSGVLQLTDDKYPTPVPHSHCIACGHCVAICPHQAIEIPTLPSGELAAAPRQLPTPEAVDGFLHARRSVRRYGAEPVDRTTLEALLEVARYAPTAKNSQLLHWIVVPTPVQVKAVADAMQQFFAQAMPALSKAADAFKAAGRDLMLRGAPTVLVVTAPADYDWGKEDAATALAYVELAAEARGLGVCWAGYLTAAAAASEDLQKLLQVPEGQVVRGGLMLGTSREHYRRIPNRKPVNVAWLESD